MFALQKQTARPKARNNGEHSLRRAQVSAGPLLTLQRRCACGGGCPRCRQDLPLQTKLEVSPPDDTLEREADRAAEQVLRMPALSDDGAARAETHHGAGLRLSRYSPKAATQNSSHVPPLVHAVLRSPGQALDPATRGFMEPRFGQDFAAVRVHTGATAARSAEAVDAQAYTVGHNIVFGADRFAPGTQAGRQLLAHELAHVVQQGAARPMLQAKPKAKKPKKTGSITFQFDPKVVSTHIWPSAWGSIGWLQETTLGTEIWDALIQAGAVVTIKFVAERADIPAGSADTSTLGFCDDLGGNQYDVYVLAGQPSFYWEKTQYGSQTMKSRTVARPADEIADTLFHELLHAWFQTLFPGEPIPTGHTANALPIGDPQFDPNEYDPRFLDRLQRFMAQIAQLKQKTKMTAAKGKP